MSEPENQNWPHGADNLETAPEAPAPVDPFEASEPAAAAQRLRAFEDAHVGPNAVRIQGRIERGFGSPFKALPPEKHEHYAALEKLIETEQALTDAHSALLAAEDTHQAQLAKVEAHEAGNAPE